MARAPMLGDGAAPPPVPPGIISSRKNRRQRRISLMVLGLSLRSDDGVSLLVTVVSVAS